MIYGVFFVFLVIYLIEITYIILKHIKNYGLIFSIILLVMNIGAILQHLKDGNPDTAGIAVSMGFNFMIQGAVIINFFVIIFHKDPKKYADELDPNYSYLDSEIMICSRCHKNVLFNETGICLKCQEGYNEEVKDKAYNEEAKDKVFNNYRKCRICKKKRLCNEYDICEKCNKKIDEKIEKEEKTNAPQDSSNKVIVEIPTPEVDKRIEELVGKYSPNIENDPKLPGIQKITENEENEELSTSKRYCTNCGKEIDQAWKYCNYCGSKLK